MILFGENVTTPAALVQLIETLRAAAAAGDQPRLLIAVDQEGGPIKRIPWAPPTLSPTQMGASGSTSVARTQGADTGAALRALGIDVDFAPVADVPASTSSFMYKAGRTFSFSATTTAAVSDAFASGLETAEVAPSMKHFPGLGYATRDTDSYVVTITASKTALAPGLKPYMTAIGHHIPMIMLSNATYPAYDSANAAGWSHAIGVTLLRGSMGFTGVTITDSLDGAAKARGVSTASLAIRAAAAGTDMILISGTEASTAADYTALINAVKAGTIPLAGLKASYTADPRAQGEPVAGSGRGRRGPQPAAARNASRPRSTIASLAVSEMRNQPGHSTIVPGRTIAPSCARRSVKAMSSGSGERTMR